MTYTEDGLVEQPAINLFSQLDWDTEICWDESFGEVQETDPLAFGRETRNDVILFKRLTVALNKLNPNIPQRILQEAIDEIARDRSAMSTIAANEVIYQLLKDGYIYRTDAEGEEDCVVIAGIDFDALAEMVAAISKPKQSDAERLKNIIERKLKPMLSKNKSRQDLQQKFMELVEEYNLGAYTAEEFFNRLKDFINDLDHEEKRTVCEGLTEEELAIFDLMVHDLPLDEKERNQVKAIAKELTTKMQDLLVIDWRKKQRTKARVRNAVEDILDDLPETYDDKLWPKTCSEVFMHIFEKYPGQGQSVYTIS